MTNRLIVCGSWDEHGGRPSGYMRSLFKGVDATIYNGGTLSQLDNLIKEPLSDADIVYWFPDIPNDAPKIFHNLPVATSYLGNNQFTVNATADVKYGGRTIAVLGSIAQYCYR